jgi:hypothetical protein
MGRPDPADMRDAFASLRRKVARARRRRETVPCSLCGQLPTPEGHDACLGILPGVQAACCGHGKTEGYVMFASGQVIRGAFDHAPRPKRSTAGARGKQ